MGYKVLRTKQKRGGGTKKASRLSGGRKFQAAERDKFWDKGLFGMFIEI